MKPIIFLFALLVFQFNTATSQIVINDSGLEMGIRSALQIDSQTVITDSMALQLTTLDANLFGISDLSGIEHFQNLQVVLLKGNVISDIQPLSTLPYLNYLNISENQISNISPLLFFFSTEMTVLVAGNCISDFSGLEDNTISDIEIIGADNQRPDCGTSSQVDILYLLDAELINTTTNEVKLMYRGWSNYNTSGLLHFGDGNSQAVVCDGQTKETTHTYADLDNITAQLLLNGESLSLDLSLLKEALNLIYPPNGDTLDNLNPYFEWNASQFTDNQYQMYVTNDTNGLVFSGFALDTNFVQILQDTLPECRWFYWKVRPYSENTFGEWSETFAFFTFCPPGSFPTAGFTVANNPPCTSGIVSFSNTSQSATAYSWSFGDSETSTEISPMHQYNTSGSYIVTLTATNEMTGLTNTFSATVVVTISDVTASITPLSNTTFCQGEAVNLSANAGANLTWQWQRNGNNLTGATSQQFSATVAGTYTVVVTNSAGCSAVSPGVQVSVLAYPVASISPSGNVAVCEGQSVNLGAGTVANLTYQWQLNGGNIGGATSSTYPASAAGDYVVVVTNGSLCTATSSAVNLQVNPLPNVLATASDDTICEGTSTTLNGTGAQDYTWQPGNLQGASIEVTPSQSTVYTLTGVDQNNCTNTATVEITVNPNPTVDLGESVTICEDATLTLHAGAGFASYLWSTGATSEEITVDAGGVYSVTVVDQNGCSGLDEIVITEMVCNATNNTLNNSQVQLYPNPNSGSFMLSIDSEVTGDLILEIVNPLGQVMTSVETTKANRVFQYDFALPDLPATVYLLKIRLDGLMGWKKFVVER